MMEQHITRLSEAREEAVGKGLRSWPVGGAGEPPLTTGARARIRFLAAGFQPAEATFEKLLSIAKKYNVDFLVPANA